MRARLPRFLALSGAVAACAALLVGPATAQAGPACPRGKIAVRGGCVSESAARTQIRALARRVAAGNDLRAVLLRVDVGGRTLATSALGNSMAGTPANLRMHFRIGSMAIPYLITLLLQEQDRGRLDLDDHVSKYLTDVPNANRITLRMLANSTSGYQDWIQGNQAFVDLLLSDVFRQWTPAELMRIAFARGPACDPGSCFHYAHTNFAVISRILRKVTGRPVATLMRERVFRPLRLRKTAISTYPAIPQPVLHAYTSDRGPYEDSTSWSPSWTIGEGTIMTSTIDEVARTARAIGTGRLISRRSFREEFAPSTVGLPPMTADRYYGLGIVVASTWRLQNPMLNGWTGIMAYLPSKRISVALTVTTGKRASRDDRSYAEVLFEELSRYLSPEHPVSLPG